MFIPKKGLAPLSILRRCLLEVTEVRHHFYQLTFQHKVHLSIYMRKCTLLIIPLSWQKLLSIKGNCTYSSFAFYFIFYFLIHLLFVYFFHFLLFHQVLLQSTLSNSCTFYPILFLFFCIFLFFYPVFFVLVLLVTIVLLSLSLYLCFYTEQPNTLQIEVLALS